MIKVFLKELLGKVCSHNYEIIDEGVLIDNYGKPCGSWYNSRCTKCGKMKRNNLRA